MFTFKKKNTIIPQRKCMKVTQGNDAFVTNSCLNRKKSKAFCFLPQKLRKQGITIQSPHSPQTCLFCPPSLILVEMHSLIAPFWKRAVWCLTHCINSTLKVYTFQDRQAWLKFLTLVIPFLTTELRTVETDLTQLFRSDLYRSAPPCLGQDSTAEGELLHTKQTLLLQTSNPVQIQAIFQKVKRYAWKFFLDFLIYL